MSYRCNSAPWQYAGQEVWVQEIAGEVDIRTGRERFMLRGKAQRRQSVLTFPPHHQGIPLGDDLGTTIFFQLVSARYERGSIMLTSNKSYGDWGSIFGDSITATAILDRLLHHSTSTMGNSQPELTVVPPSAFRSGFFCPSGRQRHLSRI